MSVIVMTKNEEDKIEYYLESVKWTDEIVIVDGKIGILEADVEHHPFKDLSQFVDRHNSYASREAKIILEEKSILPERDKI